MDWNSVDMDWTMDWMDSPSQQRAAASRVDWDAGKIRWGFGLVGAAAGSG
jgi:hypothetical protein